MTSLHLQSPRIPPLVQNLIKRTMVGILATSSLDAHPRPAIMFYYYYPTEEVIYFFTSRTSRTFRNLCENPHVAFSIDQHNLLNPLENFGVMLRGVVKGIKSEDVINRVLDDMLNKKYHFLPKDPQKLKKDYRWFVTPHRRCSRLDITTIVWWRGPYFQRTRVRV